MLIVKVRILRWNLLVKMLMAIALGNMDAIISHAVITKVPIWFIDLYAIPIEYTVVSGVITALTKLYKRIRHDR
jgi:hypothetical protein